MQNSIRYWWKTSKMAQINREISHVLELEKAKLWKWLSKENYTFNEISIKLSMAVFTEQTLKILQLFMETEKTSK